MNLEKDFEEYLINVKLWDRWKDTETKWIDRLGEKLDQAAKRTAEENNNLKEEDYLWWTLLVKLQNKYGFDKDIFGEYLELKGLTSQRNGQFFTPMSICKLMSMLTFCDTNSNQKPITVNDCACGSGRMMIAYASNIKEKDDYNTLDYVYYNQDVDYKAFIFTTLNASLRNLKSINVWGNTITLKENKTYYTIPTLLGCSAWFDKDFELKRQYSEVEKVAS